MNESSTLDSVLIKAAGILDEKEIQCWVTEGTLLGLIRENRILPWDTDVDLGVYKKDVSVPHLIQIFTAEGFKYLEVLPEMDSLHFRIDNVQLDINLYVEECDKPSVKWATNPVGPIDRLLVRSINTIFEDTKSIDVPFIKTSKIVGSFKIIFTLVLNIRVTYLR